MTTWRKEITETMGDDDAWANVEAQAGADGWLDVEFDDGYGGTEGPSFTLWTHNYVYFPVCYDGSEWCGRVARNPDGMPTMHQGGG